MSSIPATPKRDRWAHLRFAIVGPLLAAPPQQGQLCSALRELAAKTWRHPLSGADVRFAAATIERWFYAARHASDPVNRLSDRRRGDRGTFHSLAPAVIAALRAQYDAHPGWTVQLHYDNLKVALCGAALPSYPTLRRYLLAHGMRRQARLARTSAGALAARDRLEQLEVRSYEVE
ncbi:MAG: IS481 family transposase, partial [Noviherbaspirillum sp.]